MIPASWDYAARTFLIDEPAVRPQGMAAAAGPTAATSPTRPRADAAGPGGSRSPSAEVLAAGPGYDWPPAAGRAAMPDAAAGLVSAAVASPGRLAPQQVVATVRACTPPGAIATVDAGAHMLVAMPLVGGARAAQAAGLQRARH